MISIKEVGNLFEVEWPVEGYKGYDELGARG